MTDSDFTYPDDLEVLSLGQPSQLAAKVLARIAEDGGTAGSLFEIDRHGMLLIYHMMPGVTPAEQEALRSGLRDCPIKRCLMITCWASGVLPSFQTAPLAVCTC